MANKIHNWTAEEEAKLMVLRTEGRTQYAIVQALSIPIYSVKMKLRDIFGANHSTRPPLSRRAFDERVTDFHKRKKLAA